MLMDRDLLYCVLKSIAKKDDESETDLKIKDYNPDLVRYHIRLCLDAGWIRGTANSHVAVVESLTMSGQIALARFASGSTTEAALDI